MKTLAINFLTPNDEHVHTIVMRFEQDDPCFIPKVRNTFPNGLLMKKDAGMLQSVTSTLTDYLGLTTKSDYDLSLKLPSSLRSIKLTFLDDYIDLLNLSESSGLSQLVFFREIEKRMNWIEVYTLLRLASIFGNLPTISLCRFYVDETWQNEMVRALAIIVDRSMVNRAYFASNHIQKAITLLIQLEPWQGQTIREVESLSQTFLNISRETEEATGDVRMLALQTWYRLVEKLLIPWSPKIFSVLSDLKEAPRPGSVNTYLFDKYLNRNDKSGSASTPASTPVLAPVLAPALAPVLAPVLAPALALALASASGSASLENLFLSTISRRLASSTATLVDFLADLPWESSSIFLAGGSVVDSLREIMGYPVPLGKSDLVRSATFGKSDLVRSATFGKPDLVRSATFGKAGDIDLFVIGEDLEKKKAIMVQTLKMIEKHFSKEHGIYYGVGGGVLTVWFANCLIPFSIQIIMGIEKTPKELLDRFDLSCCEVLWNGKKILSTRRFVNAMATNEGYACHATLKRVLKYNNKGWAIRADENPNTKLLYNRYTKMDKKEIDEIIKAMKYASGFLPNSTGLESVVDANLYELKKRFPCLTRDFLSREGENNVHASICEHIRDFANYVRTDDLTDAEKEEKKEKERKQLNVGVFEEISWNASKSAKDDSFGLKMWYPKMEKRSISLRIDAIGCKLKDLGSNATTNRIVFLPANPSASASKYGDPESQMRVSCDHITITTFLNIVNELFNDFLKQKVGEASSNKLMKSRMVVQETNETPSDMAKTFTKTTWPRKLLETGVLCLKERKWENAELFYKGPGLKRERLGLIGDKFMLGQPSYRRFPGPSVNSTRSAENTVESVELFSDLSNYKVSLDLNFKVVLMVDEYIPCISVNSMTLSDC